ncbi:MAG: thioredoxin-like domain-containing protein [Planctomycetaceae bacterium]
MRLMISLTGCVICLLLAGCGKTETPSTANSNESGTAASRGASDPADVAGTLPETTHHSAPTSSGSAVPAVTASLSNPKEESLPPDGGSAVANSASQPDAPPAPGDEAMETLQKIQKLRLAPVPSDLEQARAARRDRNLEIIDLATRVLALTVEDTEKQAVFNQAISQLLEARFQLALAGSKDDIDQLYADVEALNDRDPESVGAMEGVYYLAKFAHTKARLQGGENTVWFENFSRWAREFADRFPDQSARAVQLLFGAGRSCEMHSVVTDSADERTRLMTEAKLCYSALAEKWPDTSQGQEAAGVLRRLALPGQPLSQFSGPTLEGGYISSDEFPGKITVIYFWESESEEFVTDLLPLLQQANTKLSEQVRFVGVNLDEEEVALNDFLEKNSVPGRQIFFASQEQRSWDSPLVRFWGVSKNPSVWIVKKDGVVSAVDVGHATLVEEMRKLF